jgi:hypothetical protein
MKILIITESHRDTNLIVSKIVKALKSYGLNDDEILSVASPQLPRGVPEGVEAIVMFTSSEKDHREEAKAFLKAGYRVLLYHFRIGTDYLLGRKFSETLRQRAIALAGLMGFRVDPDNIKWLIDA